MLLKLRAWTKSSTPQQSLPMDGYILNALRDVLRIPAKMCNLDLKAAGDENTESLLTPLKSTAQRRALVTPLRTSLLQQVGKETKISVSVSAILFCIHPTMCYGRYIKDLDFFSES